MARIKEYNSQQAFSGDAFGNTARAQESSGYYQGRYLEQGAQKIEQGIKTTEEHVAANETSKLAADMATAHAELATEWNDALAHADPNDHEAANRFMEQRVKPRLSKIGEGLLTEQAQGLFARSSAGVGAELFTKTAADQARLAGEAAITNLDTVKNQLSNVARGDPTSLNSTLFSSDAAVDELVRSHNLPSEEAIKLKRAVRSEIAKSAVDGAIDNNAVEAKKALDRGDYNDLLDGTTINALRNTADQHIKAEEAAKRLADAEQRRQESDAAETFANQVRTSTTDPETGVNRLPPDYYKKVVEYGKMPGAQTGTLNSLYAVGAAMERNPILRSDVDTRTNFMGRIWLGKDDPNKLTLADVDAAFGDFKLNKADHTMMRQAIMDADKDPNKAENMRELSRVMSSLKSTITKSSMFTSDADGDSRFGMMQQDKTNQFLDGLKNGVSAKAMLDPTSKDYIFKDVQRYQPAQNSTRFQQQLQGTAGPIGPPSVVPWASAPSFYGNVNKPTPGRINSTLPQRNTGESAADFIKRTGGP